MDNIENATKKFTILLLTNRDSDNVGDQVIEASDIALLHSVMQNLKIGKGSFVMKLISYSIWTKSFLYDTIVKNQAVFLVEVTK